MALTTLIGATPIAALDVGLDSLRNARGLVRLCLTADPDNFPACVDDVDAVTRTVPAKAASTRFEGLAPGTYAVAVIHDENGNSRLDTLAGIPREGFGFSRNPAIGFGPPRFTAARFVLPVEGTRQRITMRYIF